MVLAVIIWLVVNHSLTTSKIMENIAVRVINIPSGMTLEGLQANGVLTNKISLNLTGNRTILNDLTPNDLEVVVDATEKSEEWQVTVAKKNLVSLNPDLDLSKIISRVTPYRFTIHLTRLVSEKIPVVVTTPIGEAPRDYQFLDIWPYHLTVTVSGPEEVVKQLKAKGLNLTLNLNDISYADLDALQHQDGKKDDEVSYFVPDEWKKISVPAISERPLEIDDPQAKHLRVDFVRCDLHPIAKSIPLNLFYPPEYSMTLNPETYSLAPKGIVQQFHGIPIIRKSLYAKGVSRLFVEVVEDMLEISVVLAPKSERRFLDWSVQFINPKMLEDRYVSMLMTDASEDDMNDVPHKKREEYLRNRFRSYMNRFSLFNSNEQKFDLKIELQNNSVEITEKPL